MVIVVIKVGILIGGDIYSRPSVLLSGGHAPSHVIKLSIVNFFGCSGPVYTRLVMSG